MKRKTRFRFDVWPQLVLAALNVVFMVVFIFQKVWPIAVWIGFIDFWILDSYFAKRKIYRLREAAIGLFNIINPTKELGDEDWADFKVVEKDGKATIDITVRRVAEKKATPDAPKANNEEQNNGQV